MELDFSDLRALYVNCTLKRSPERSNTQGLIDRSTAIMRQHGVEVSVDLAAEGAGGERMLAVGAQRHGAAALVDLDPPGARVRAVERAEAADDASHGRDGSSGGRRLAPPG